MIQQGTTQDKRLQWYNPAGFVLQPQGTPGNLGRDLIRGPRLFNMDFPILKDTKIREDLNLQFRAEFLQHSEPRELRGAEPECLYDSRRQPERGFDHGD